jgi:hypothetical protein
MFIQNFLKQIISFKKSNNLLIDKKFLEDFLPQHKLNYNTSESDKDKYLVNFTKKYRETIIPYLIKNKKDKLPKIIDIGCGFSPLAISYLSYLRVNDISLKDIIYVGIDINENAINWLKEKFESYNNFYFHKHEAPQMVSYINLGTKKNTDINTQSQSDGFETKYKIPISFNPDFQLSGSFFTHLTPSAVNSALNFVNEISNKDTISINSWIIIDDESKNNLSEKKTDRVLNIDMGDYLTYSKSNPLVCTAYKIEKIQEFYKKNGLEIINISKGHWRGGSQKNIFNTKQDIIISRKI